MRGIYAAGDLTSRMQGAIIAAAASTQAAAMIDVELSLQARCGVRCELGDLARGRRVRRARGGGRGVRVAGGAWRIGLARRARGAATRRSARDAWQRPDDVVRALELTPAMTVADVGAGTGYFAVRSRAQSRRARCSRAISIRTWSATSRTARVANTWRTCALFARRRRAPCSPRTASTRSSSSTSGTTSRIRCSAYARDLAAALRPGGKLLVVEFRLDAQRGPPATMWLAPDTVVADFAAAGLAAEGRGKCVVRSVRRRGATMRRDSRLSGVLHVLLHMAEQDGPRLPRTWPGRWTPIRS